jgi:hypothetical protein
MKRILLTLAFLAIILFVVIGCKSSVKTGAVSYHTPSYVTPQKSVTPIAATPIISHPSRNEAEEQTKFDAMKQSIYKGRLLQYFDAITTSDDMIAANTSVDRALTLFTSSQAPAHIVGDQKNNKPTTIRAFLNYLRDQKNNDCQIESVKLDKYGKITEVELRKSNVITYH